MGISLSLKEYLDGQGIEYDVQRHKKTGCSSRTAKASHISGDCLAKAVVLKRKKGYLLAIIPASRDVALNRVGHWLKQTISLATEDELSTLFADCAVGAVPPVGAAYGLRTIVDRDLSDGDDIYFEAGDHKTLVHLTGADFDKLMQKAPHRDISRQPGRSGSEKLTPGNTAVEHSGLIAGYWGA